jgi:hypothetical protein
MTHLPSPEVLADLLERVKAASGPLAMIDWDIEEAFGDWENLGGARKRHKVTGEDRTGYIEPQGAYTASLDATLALVERVLPGWSPAIRRDPRPAFERLWHAFVARNGSGREQHAGWGSTPALALLTAMLTALSQGATGPSPVPGGTHGN